MNIEFIQVASAAVIVMLLSVTLKDIKREYAVILSVIGAILLMTWGIGQINPVIQKISELTERSGIDEQCSEALFKSLGISVITRLSYDVCCDAGETAIASKVDFCGRISLLLIAIPLFERLLDLAGEIILA